MRAFFQLVGTMALSVGVAFLSDSVLLAVGIVVVCTVGCMIYNRNNPVN